VGPPAAAGRGGSVAARGCPARYMKRDPVPWGGSARRGSVRPGSGGGGGTAAEAPAAASANARFSSTATPPPPKPSGGGVARDGCEPAVGGEGGLREEVAGVAARHTCCKPRRGGGADRAEGVYRAGRAWPAGWVRCGGRCGGGGRRRMRRGGSAAGGNLGPGNPKGRGGRRGGGGGGGSLGHKERAAGGHGSTEGAGAWACPDGGRAPPGKEPPTTGAASGAAATARAAAAKGPAARSQPVRRRRSWAAVDAAAAALAVSGWPLPLGPCTVLVPQAMTAAALRPAGRAAGRNATVAANRPIIYTYISYFIPM
jgi:hypothetical protein